MELLSIKNILNKPSTSVLVYLVIIHRLIKTVHYLTLLQTVMLNIEISVFVWETPELVIFYSVLCLWGYHQQRFTRFSQSIEITLFIMHICFLVPEQNHPSEVINTPGLINCLKLLMLFNYTTLVKCNY